MKLVNLTPHPIVVFDAFGNSVSIPPSGKVARIDMNYSSEPVRSVDVPVSDFGVISVPVYDVRKSDIINLPDPEPDTLYITSAIVAEEAARRGYTDVIAPDTTRAVRDEVGNIIGVKGFVRYRNV